MGLFSDNLQHCLGTFARLLKPQITINEFGFETDTKGGHCQRFVMSLEVLLRPTESYFK